MTVNINGQTYRLWLNGCACRVNLVTEVAPALEAALVTTNGAALLDANGLYLTARGE